MDQPESISRQEDAPRWLLVCVVLLLMAGSGAALYWLGASGSADRVFGKPTTLGNERVITGLGQILDEPAKGNLIGRDVQMDSVAVQEPVGEYIFWIGSDEENRVAVLSIGEMGRRAAGAAARLQADSVVAIFGRVRTVGSGRVFQEDPGLTEEQRAALNAKEVYIAADQVLTESQPSGTTAERGRREAHEQALNRIREALDGRGSVDFERQVTIRGAGVQSVVGDYTFWIGRDRDKRIPVVLIGEMTGRQRHRATIVRRGDVITIFGVVRATGQGRIFGRDAMLDDEQRSELTSTDIYIAADQVLVHGR